MEEKKHGLGSALSGSVRCHSGSPNYNDSVRALLGLLAA